ncbi:hypothetical protein DLM45_00295 [Hyphomicrobium methylovorum]|uniref:anti-sigma factor n=1 Tax=Hyphomicrobium methylovorum TaxID=84 RepID=UPI0015E7A65B|nr:anti-sigma factor [Hyphomicrobium methylovorum]MBA2124669.1 hypothetical protein [Hyphomicrobium methylovorum]
MTDNRRPIGLDKLEAALDTYGADRTRWPAPLRHELSGLIATSEPAQKLLQDAELFDRLLDSAPQYDMNRIDGLKSRIVMAAERQPRIVSSANVVAPSRTPRRHHGFVATALAASLVLGVLAGQSGMVNSLVGDQAAANGTRQIAQVDDTDILLDEDLL